MYCNLAFQEHSSYDLYKLDDTTVLISPVNEASLSTITKPLIVEEFDTSYNVALELISDLKLNESITVNPGAF